MEAPATENAVSPLGVAASEVAADADQPVEGASVEDRATPAVTPEAGLVTDQVIDDAAPEDEKQRDPEVHVDVTPQEMRSIIEVIADTGKFWHDWSFLRGLLSLQLKQALAGYSEVQTMDQEDGRQQGLLGETHTEIFHRLNNALMSFEEGPPFTLQRICEILLDAKDIYKIVEACLRIGENLLVTSTLTRCNEPYPTAHGSPLSSEGAQITDNIGAAVAGAVDVNPESVPESTGSETNGIKHGGGDGDEEMVDAEVEEVSCTRDVEMQEKPDQDLSVSPDANSDATVGNETVNVSETSPDPQS